MTTDDDWFVAESAAMAPHEIRQRYMAEHRPGDDEPVAIQRRRLEKVALILETFAFDEVGESADARAAIQYLRLESIEQYRGPGATAPSAAELGERIDALEWPAKPA
ncbi:hypothetical protein [Promicromonospora sp. NFX87]|uniref:hypothetical protein n=1 Tax=Promicromonospora sp. NFX87 TaxID=3402691 RepID=UPI003AFA73EA